MEEEKKWINDLNVHHFVDEDGNQIKVYYPRRQKSSSENSEEEFHMAIPNEVYEAYKAYQETKNIEKNPGIDLSSKHTRRSCRKAKENPDGGVQSDG